MDRPAAGGADVGVWGFRPRGEDGEEEKLRLRTRKAEEREEAMGSFALFLSSCWLGGFR